MYKKHKRKIVLKKKWIISWLKEYTEEEIHQHIDSGIDLETFYNHVTINSKPSLIKGIAHGVKVEDIKEDTMRYIRYLDKLIDELTKKRHE